MKKLIFALAVMLGCGGLFIQSAEAKPKDKQYHYSKVYKHKNVKNAARVTPEETKKPVAVSTVYNDDSNAAYWMHEYNRNPQHASVVTKATSSFASGTGNLADKAAKYLGSTASQLGLPRSLWCADFMNMLVGGTDRRAISYASRGTKAQHGCVNCVAVTTRKGGAHVGVVSGYDESGNPIIVSGNHNRKVGVAAYDKRRIIAYRYI